MNRNKLFLRRGAVQTGDGLIFEGIENQRGHGRMGRRCIFNQRGFGVAMRFKGEPFQLGHGFWKNILGWVTRKVLPRALGGVKAVSKGVANMAKEQAMSTGIQILGDIASGENVVGSVKSRFKEGGKQLAATGKQKLEKEYEKEFPSSSPTATAQTGSGRKRKRKSSPIVSSTSGANKKRCTFKCTSLPYKNIFE